MTSRLGEALGIDVPLIQGPMGGVAGPRLVAAVANAGAFGVLPIWADSLANAQKGIEETRRSIDGDRPFAVNLRSDLEQSDHIRLATDCGVRWFHVFWGDPRKTAAEIRGHGGRFIATVGDVDVARSALDGGAAALVAQGVEAGGHVASEVPLADLLPAVIDCAGDVPVVAAGGIGNEADAKAAIEMGAAGILCGTRFVASEESKAHPLYKKAIVQASAEDTVRSLCFDLGWTDAPHRTLRNESHAIWERAGCPPMGERPGERDVILTLEAGIEWTRYFVVPPAEDMSGDILGAALYAGTSVGRIDAIEPVSAIIERFRKVLPPVDP